MSISPMRPVAYTPPASGAGAYYAATPPTPVGYVPAAAVPSAAPTGPGMGALARSAMTGQDLPGASPFQSKVLGLVRAGQATMSKVANAIMPPAPPRMSVMSTAPQTLTDKLKQVGRSALFFAIPVGGAAAVACLLGWMVGPLVPMVGGHVFGAVFGTLAVGETAGALLHGAMRLPLVTDPAQRDVNSAGVTLGSAVLGAGFAGAIALAAGNPVTLPIILLGAALGAVPRLFEWGIGHH